mgnify:CR=1 FL=1
MPSVRSVAVIGGGWAGLAAATSATAAGMRVSVHEMAPQLGGRARTIDSHGLPLDNGQHILIGAYTETLALMRTVGIDVSQALLRTPLRICYPEGSGLQMRPGAPVLAFLAAVARYPGWSLSAKAALLSTATRWALTGFHCDEAWTVERLTSHLPPAVRQDLLEPLCVAALNTPANQASAAALSLSVLREQGVEDLAVVANVSVAYGSDVRQASKNDPRVTRFVIVADDQAVGMHARRVHVDFALAGIELAQIGCALRAE